MKLTAYLIVVYLFCGQSLSAQPNLRVVQAQLLTTYQELLQDPELHYCCQGFSVDSLRASSILESQTENLYHVNNLGDNQAATAWVEGAKGSGIGEFIRFDYAYDIAYAQAAEGAFNYKDEWQILNGYQKSLQTWQDNGRIKRLKMYINEVAFCYINLLDEPGIQTISLGFLDYLEKDKGTIRIKLEIADIYAGDKYMDTALS